MTRLLIADDHALARAGLRVLLEQAGHEVVAEAGDAEDAAEAAVRERPDVCLIDVQMPGNGVEAARAINRSVPTAKIVMLSGACTDTDLFDALAAGACGYLLKDYDATSLDREVRRVVEDGATLPASFVARLIDEFRRRERRGWTRGADRGLTSREREVFELLADGLTTRDTAGVLGISSTTVRRHVGAILRKLGVPTREAAVRLVSGDAA